MRPGTGTTGAHRLLVTYQGNRLLTPRVERRHQVQLFFLSPRQPAAFTRPLAFSAFTVLCAAG